MPTKAHAESLNFGGSISVGDLPNIVDVKQDMPIVYLPGPGMEYRNSVLKSYQDYLISKGITDVELLRRASAILVHENESLDPNRTHDDHLGFGICGRYVKIKYERYKVLYPQEVTLDAQIRWCGDRFVHYYNLYKGMKAERIEYMPAPDSRKIVTTEGMFRLWVSHNCPACAAKGQNTTHLKPPYFQRVQYAYEKLKVL